MTATSTALAGTRRDLTGRGLLAFAAIASVGAFANGIVVMSNAADDRLWVESRRTTAFLVFAGLLAWAPRAQPGVWELVFGQKAAVVVIAAVIGDVPEARSNGLVDAGLVMILVTSYLLCRGWLSWRTRPA